MTELDHIEVTETEADKLTLAFWYAYADRSANGDVYPTTVPDDFDPHVDEDGDWESAMDKRDAHRIPDDERAQEITTAVHAAITDRGGSGLSNAAFTATGGGRRDAGTQRAVFVVPEWFSKDEWGHWNAVYVAAFEGETKSGKAYKFRNIVEWSDRGEDSYFLDPIEFSTVPKSLCTVFTGARDAVANGAVYARDDADKLYHEDTGRDPRDCAVTLSGIKTTQYGAKVTIDFEPPWGDEARHEAIKEILQDFPWGAAHATFDGDDWTMDPGYVYNAILKLTVEGFDVGVTEAVMGYVDQNVDPDLKEDFRNLPVWRDGDD